MRLQVPMKLMALDKTTKDSEQAEIIQRQTLESITLI